MKFTEIDKAIMIGLIIGDGTLGKDGKFGVIHSIKQLDYCIFKAKLLHSIVGGRDIKVHESVTKYKYKEEVRESQICRFSKCSKSFIPFRQLLYPDGKKYISNEMLSYLNETSLALWWMDDGNLDCHKSGSGRLCYELR
jgi:hypothetical protein